MKKDCNTRSSAGTFKNPLGSLDGRPPVPAAAASRRLDPAGGFCQRDGWQPHRLANSPPPRGRALEAAFRPQCQSWGKSLAGEQLFVEKIMPDDFPYYFVVIIIRNISTIFQGFEVL